MVLSWQSPIPYTCVSTVWWFATIVEVCCCNPCIQEKDGRMTKYQNFANLKWRTAAILKIVFGYISTIYCPINVKFDTQKQNYVQIQVTWPKYQNLKIQVGGRLRFWKWCHHYISAADHPISMKFGVPLHNLIARRSIIKVSKFCKFKMADCCYIENRFWLYLNDLLSN